MFALEIPQLFEIILDRKIEEPKAEDSQISNDILVACLVILKVPK